MAVPMQIPMEFGQVFPAGAFVTGPVEPVPDFDKGSGRDRPQKLDRETGLRMWSVPVLDADESVRSNQRSVKVNVLADHQPVPPDALAGTPFRPVEFEGMTVTPYVAEGSGRARVAYSLRARAMRAPGVSGGRGKSAAPAA
jgi:hypothetical protein